MNDCGPRASILQVISAHLINACGLLALYGMYNETGIELVDLAAVIVAVVLIGLTLLTSLIFVSTKASIMLVHVALRQQKPIVSLGHISNFVWDICYLAMFVAHSSWIIAFLYIGHIIVYNNFRKKLPIYVEALTKIEEERLKRGNS